MGFVLSYYFISFRIALIGSHFLLFRLLSFKQLYIFFPCSFVCFCSFFLLLAELLLLIIARIYPLLSLFIPFLLQVFISLLSNEFRQGIPLMLVLTLLNCGNSLWPLAAERSWRELAKKKDCSAWGIVSGLDKAVRGRDRLA